MHLQPAKQPDLYREVYNMQISQKPDMKECSYLIGMHANANMSVHVYYEQSTASSDHSSIMCS